MSVKSVLELARFEMEGPSNIQKSMDGDGYAVPKSWFNDPYALLDSMGLGYRAAPSTLSYETLKQMSEKNVVIAAIIQTRLNQVASFCQPQRNKYSIGYKVQHRNPRHKLSHSEKEHVAKMERFIANMGVDRNKERDGFEMWVRKVTRDRLVYDQLNSEKVLRRNGKPHSIHAVPADTIRLASSRSKKGSPLTVQEAKFTPKYVQIIDGSIVNQYLSDEFIFRVSNPRTDIRTFGYGFSELEMLINTVTSHLWAEEWNRKVFSQGSTIKGILNLKGNIPAQQLEAFKRMWLTQVSGVSNSWRTPIMNSDEMQWVPLQPSNNDMGYQQWLEYLIKIACAVYLIDPAEINFDTRGGVGNQPMFMTTNEAQQKVSKDRGLQPLLRFIQNVVNEEIVYELDEDYEFLFVGMDSRTESEAIELRMKEAQSYKTLNEIRREADELPPVKNGDVVMNATYIGYLQNKEMQAQQPQPGAPGAPPGGPPGAGGLPGQGDEQQMPPKEMFEQQFGGGAPSGAEAAFGNKVKADLKNSAHPEETTSGKEEESTKQDEKGTKKKDEETFSREETEDDWEETVHASMRLSELRGKLTRDFQKAVSIFDELL